MSQFAKWQATGPMQEQMMVFSTVQLPRILGEQSAQQAIEERLFRQVETIYESRRWGIELQQTPRWYPEKL